jgi:hypothetical protein
MSTDVSDMISGPYKYEKDLHSCFRIVLPEQGGRLVACIYATGDGSQEDAETLAEADAILFAQALRREAQDKRLPGYTQYTSYRP